VWGNNRTEKASVASSKVVTVISGKEEKENFSLEQYHGAI